MVVTHQRDKLNKQTGNLSVALYDVIKNTVKLTASCATAVAASVNVMYAVTCTICESCQPNNDNILTVDGHDYDFIYVCKNI